MKINKKIIAMVLCLLIIFGFNCISAGAKTVFPVGDWVYEKINNNTEFEVDEYKGDEAEVTTEGSYNALSITSIGEHAFTGNSTLNKITFSDSIKYIQKNAFVNAVNLETVVFTSSVESIGSKAFAGCSSLSDINLEDTSVAEISNSSFMNCDALTEITLPNTVTTIASNAFSYCDELNKVTIPESVTTIDEYAFYNSNSVVIYCYEGSYAQSFAETNSIEYVIVQPAETYVLGDSDNDGIITVLDATMVQLVLAQKMEADDKFSIRGDVDSDNAVSVMDATLIQQYVAGYNLDSYDISKTFEY